MGRGGEIWSQRKGERWREAEIERDRERGKKEKEREMERDGDRERSERERGGISPRARNVLPSFPLSWQTFVPELPSERTKPSLITLFSTVCLFGISVSHYHTLAGQLRL